ncbi:MAG: hypothetical protein LBU11_02875 [Zoogloeaceae bacterium]|jgi:hypothetical protein|nr:hypothetical protein [Zoogloeaceae bacterium]
MKPHQICYRFADKDCRLSDEQKKSIVFLNGDMSRKIWNDFVSDKHHLFLMDRSEYIFLHQFCVINTDAHDFSHTRQKLEKFFTSSSFMISLWGPACGALCHPSILASAWDDFFYPSDENTVAIGFPNRRCVFSYENYLYLSKARKMDDRRIREKP